jgi:hypothetical protein
VTVPEEIGTGRSYRLEVEKAYTDQKPKGQGGFKINDFGITIAETRGACVIAIFWTGQKWAKEQDGPRRRFRSDYRLVPVQVFGNSKAV